MRDIVKVLHVGKYYPPHMGGMETYLQQLVSYQSGQVEASAIVANDSPRTQIESIDGARIARVASLGVVASMPITPTMAWHIRRQAADLVHLHTPNPGAALALLASGHRAPIVITHHADVLGRRQLRRLSDPFLGRVMQRAVAIIVTSKRYLNSSTELAPFRDKCHIIPLGIDPARFEDPAGDGSTGSIRAKFGGRLVLAVGRLVPYKGFDVLIRAMKAVNGSLLLIGTGPLHAELQAHIQRCGVQEKIQMLGHVEQIAPYYKAADVFAIPSVTRAEAFGVVQLEAMAAGIPVVNTDIPSGAPEVSIHGETGLTVPPSDPEALAAAINLLLDDVELRKRLGGAGHARVRANFTAEQVVRQTMDVYRSIGVTAG